MFYAKLLVLFKDNKPKKYYMYLTRITLPLNRLYVKI